MLIRSIVIVIYSCRITLDLTEAYRKQLTIILFSHLFFLTLPCRSAYANKYY